MGINGTKSRKRRPWKAEKINGKRKRKREVKEKKMIYINHNSKMK